jgi:hypothetical protein
MRPNTAFLSAEERHVLNLLMQAADQMTLIFRRQAKATDGPDGPGHGFYPAGLTKAGFEAYLAAHPSEKATLLDELAVVRRRGDRLVAVPYSQEYRSELEKAAVLLERAADVTTNASLKQFLRVRAGAFRSNDYYQSELAWVDVKDTPIEISIGPNGANIDELLGQKAAFRASILVRNSEASAALERYTRYLQAMETNLPVADRYKNFKRGSVSPIVVADQLWHGGASTVGPQGIAFNLPDDERIREAKGARKVVISNVLDAKYDSILRPMITRVLVSDQTALVSRTYFSRWILFHELSHSLGPGSITVGGRATTVSAELRDIGATAEEAKADVMGVYNVEFMMQKGELPLADRSRLLATYFVSLLRAVRFGDREAHGRGAALQYGYLESKGAFAWDAGQRRFRIDDARMASGVRDLVGELVRLQGDGDYTGMVAFFDRYAHLDARTREVIATLRDIPVDIAPIYHRLVTLSASPSSTPAFRAAAHGR